MYWFAFPNRRNDPSQSLQILLYKHETLPEWIIVRFRRILYVEIKVRTLALGRPSVEFTVSMIASGFERVDLPSIPLEGVQHSDHIALLLDKVLIKMRCMGKWSEKELMQTCHLWKCESLLISSHKQYVVASLMKPRGDVNIIKPFRDRRDHEIDQNEDRADEAGHLVQRRRLE